MRRLFGLALALCFFLSGCRAPFSLPRAEEPRSTSIISVLGVENGEKDGIKVLAVSQKRREQEALLFESRGDSLSGALLGTRDQGTQTVSYAHVEHILVGAETAKTRLSQLLSFCFQNGEQSIESNIWLLRNENMDAVFAGDLDLANRLSTLKTSGEAGTSLPPRTLRETAAKLADDGSVLIPALRWENDDLEFDSYAIFRNGDLLGYLDGNLARTTAVLAQESIFWTRQIPINGEREATVQLHSSGCSVKPLLQDGELKSLNITCDVEGKLMEVWSVGTKEQLHNMVEQQTKLELEQTIKRLQQLNADGADLRRQAGISTFWRWDTIDEQWQARFSNLPCKITVKAKLTEHF